MKKILITILSLMLCVGLLSPTVLALQDSVLIQGETYRVEDYYYKDPPKRTASSQADLGGAITALLSAMDRVDPDCDISGYQVHKDQMGYVFSVLSSDPDFFYITSFNYSHYSVSGIVFKVTFFYIGVKEDILPMKVLYNQAVDKTLQIFDPAMTAPEKTLIAHDYLALHTKYDEENAIQGTIPHISHTAYGALVLGVAVCDGYSRAYIALLSRAGLDVIKISSESMNHAWNMVKLGSYWYHVDVTWDDPVFDPEYNWYNNDYDLEGSVRHEYFLLSDSKISSDHSGWSSPYPANSSLYDGKYIDIKSGMFWQGGFWYYNESGKIKRSDFNLNNTTIIKADVNGSGNRYSYIGLYNNRIYYNYTLSGNSKSFIKSIKLDGSDERDELTIDNTGKSVKEQITEMVILDGLIRYTVCRHINTTTRQYEVRTLELASETVWSLSPAAGSSTVIDQENHFIYGLAENLNHSDLFAYYLDFDGDIYLSIESSGGDRVGTGSELKVYNLADDSLLESYYILIFGDLNGDGAVDSADAGTISDVENFLIAWDSSVSGLYEFAADLNRDGAIDAGDSGLITDSENFLVSIDQATGLAA